MKTHDNGQLVCGIGGFPLNAAVAPTTASFLAAIASFLCGPVRSKPFPIEVTRLRFPDMVHVGDITKLDGAELPPVDIICGGSPCQDLSVAGTAPVSRRALRACSWNRSDCKGDEKCRRIDNEAEQLSIYDLDSWCGRTFPEPSQWNTKRRRFRCVLEETAELKSVVFQSLDLTPGAGNLLGESYWELISPWRGDALTLNTGVSPEKKKESSLSQILQDDPPDKYYLTRKACLGILRRALEREKSSPRSSNGRWKSIWSSTGRRRHQPIRFTRDQHQPARASGALMANFNNMQMQTLSHSRTRLMWGFDGYNGDLTGSVAATLGVNCGMSTGRNGLDPADCLCRKPGMRSEICTMWPEHWAPSRE